MGKGFFYSPEKSRPTRGLALFNGYRVCFPVVKRALTSIRPLTPSTAEGRPSCRGLRQLLLLHLLWYNTLQSPLAENTALAHCPHHFPWRSVTVITVRKIITVLTLRLLMSYIYIYIYIYIYGAPILDVSRSHTTTHHSQ